MHLLILTQIYFHLVCIFVVFNLKGPPVNIDVNLLLWHWDLLLFVLMLELLSILSFLITFLSLLRFCVIFSPLALWATSLLLMP